MKLFTYLLLIFTSFGLYAQNCGGNIIRGAYRGFLNPDGNGYITNTGAGFSNCNLGYIDEMNEFEDLRTGCNTCEIPWTPIPIGSETIGDLWAGGSSCGNTEIVPDALTGTYGYYTIIDPNGICGDNDELLIFRVRVDASVNGSFSYTLLVDSDNALGANDPDGIACGTKVANAGFEYEVVADPANNGTVEVRNINGVAGQYGEDPAHSNRVPRFVASNTTHYNQAKACRSICSGGCGGSGAVYHTFAVPLSAIDKSCMDTDIRFVGSTASSGNGTISSNTSVSDIAGYDGEPSCPDPTVPCNCCTACQDASNPFYCSDISACLTGCLMSCVAEGNTTGVFPIELISFTAEVEAFGVAIDWLVATEENNDYYELQRSMDGVNFSTIHEVDGAGTTHQQQHYEYFDEGVQGATIYYRLKYVDFLGNAEYSIVIAVNLDNDFENEIQVYPTKVEQALNINFNLPKEDDVNIRIFNIYGQVVFQKSINLNRGYSHQQLNLAHLDAGNYILSIQLDHGVTQFNQRIVR